MYTLYFIKSASSLYLVFVYENLQFLNQRQFQLFPRITLCSDTSTAPERGACLWPSPDIPVGAKYSFMIASSTIAGQVKTFFHPKESKTAEAVNLDAPLERKKRSAGRGADRGGRGCWFLWEGGGGFPGPLLSCSNSSR